MTRKKPDVVVIGELNVDIILNSIHAFPAVGKEMLAQDLIITLGSSSAIFASNLACLGVSVSFIGKTGNDSFAEDVISALNSKRVITDRILRDNTLKTGATIVLNFDQDRANITYPGAMNSFCIGDVDFSYLGSAKHMHFSSFFIQPGIRSDVPALFRKAKESGLTTSLDPQWDPDEKWDFPTEELLPWVDVFLPNEAELRNITRTPGIVKGIEKIRSYSKHIVVKNGKDGSVGWDGNKLYHQDAYINSRIVDCVGAGDCFNAGYISKFIKNWSLPECMKFGALIGAINTTRAGGTGSFGSEDEVRAIALEQFNMEI
jgi:sugar/nucleoside kinase (ribokinase family)